MQAPPSSRNRMVDLPAPTGAAACLLNEVCTEIPSADSVNAILVSDSLLARRFLRLSRSQLLGGDSSIHGVNDVMPPMGIVRLRHVGIAAAVMHLLPAEQSGERFDRLLFWEHAAAVGVLARLLVRDFDITPSLAFVAGLVHDLGRLVLDVHFPREFYAVLQYQMRHDTWIRDAEAAVLGYDHCAIGERVASAWGLPALLVEAIGYHHQPDRTNPAQVSELTAIIHVADVLARGLQVGNPGDDTIPMLSETTLRRLRLNWTSLRECLGEAEPGMHEMRRLLREMMLPGC